MDALSASSATILGTLLVRLLPSLLSFPTPATTATDSSPHSLQQDQIRHLERLEKFLQFIPQQGWVKYNQMKEEEKEKALGKSKSTIACSDSSTSSCTAVCLASLLGSDDSTLKGLLCLRCLLASLLTFLVALLATFGCLSICLM